MDIDIARTVLGLQDRNLRRLKDARFGYKGYEYRVNYEGGFASYVAIDRRKSGTRNFKYFDGFGAYNCATAQEAYNKAIDIVMAKERSYN